MPPRENPPREPVAVEVIIPAETESFSGARLRARLDDVTMADAPAECLDRRDLDEISHQQGRETRVPLTLSFIPASRALVVVNVHIDRQHSGGIRRGDLINMESFPVQPGAPAPLTVRVRQV